MAPAEQYLQEALNAFDFGGEVVGAVRFGSGHINDTFCVHTQPGEDPCRRFILQRIRKPNLLTQSYCTSPAVLERAST